MENKKSNRTQIIELRLSPKEFDQIEEKFKKSSAGKLSEYVRRILFDKPTAMYQRNQPFDDIMAEMIKLRGELNGIGNNFNQAVKKLNSMRQIAQFRDCIISYQLEKKIHFNKIDEIKNRINKIADQWLR
jgi:hypothetical protein